MMTDPHSAFRIPQSPVPVGGVRATAEAFGHEWTTHGDLASLYPTEADLEREFSTYRIPADFFAGKRVLDAGCGMGRYSYMAGRQGARCVVGMDLHDGVYAARRLTAPLKNVRLLKGSIFALPFCEGQFDSVMSIGVLHHTGDTPAAFQAVARMVRPGGRLFVQVYATRGEAQDRRMARLLRWTARMPRRLLYAGCVLAVALRATPLLKWLIQGIDHYVQIVSWSRRRSFWRNVADTFDWHCCPYRTYHTAAEVMGWFRAAGFVEITDTNPSYGGGVNMMGKFPVPSTPQHESISCGTI
ncbi:MAG: class I SAM-dependent methyltransferase [Candidatus Brocadiia bacterium]